MSDSEQGANAPETAPAPAPHRPTRGDPPLHSRFKPGVSGNPSGRKKGSKNFATLVRQEMDRTITITDQPGLNPNRRRWRSSPPEMALPRATPAQGAQPVFSPPTLPYARDAVPGPGPTRLTP